MLLSSRSIAALGRHNYELLCFLVLIFASSGEHAVATTTADERPNIVLIMCDDLGWGDVGFNGNQVIQTPNLDRWAQCGLVLERFYSAAPVCSPTRGSCLTGRHPFRYGIYTANSGHLPTEEITLTEVLKKQGYATGHFGKWHLGTLTTEKTESNRGGPRGRQHYSPPWQHGFDTCFSTEAKVPTWDPMIKPSQAAHGRWWRPVKDHEGSIPYNTHYWDERGNEVEENLAGDNSRVITDRVVPFVREHAERGTPFFAVIWFHTPHLPVVAGPEYAGKYEGHTPYAQSYFGCVTALDDQIGRLIHELQRLAVASNTLVWFCSDNGPEGNAKRAPGSAGPFRGRKRDLFEGGIRVPAFLVWPARIRAGRRSTMASVTSDIFPSVLDILNVDMPTDRPYDGISLVPLMKGEQTERRQAIGFKSAQQQAWTEDRFKLLVRKQNTMLFDLITDPSESRDIAQEHPDVVSRMDHDLKAWIESCKLSDAGNDYP